MTESRSVVVTGASRGLGLASAAHLYRNGWRVVAAMRSVDKGMAALHAETGAAVDDPRLIGVRLDLVDEDSVAAAAAAIEEAVGAPDAIVHNAGIASAGTVEETPMELWRQMFETHLFGPVALTKALLPGMRAAGRGRIVVISSAGGVRGMPAIAAYSAAKGATERWAESMAGEIAAFGLGVTVIVTGVFDTEIITDDGLQTFRDFDGPYGRHHTTIDKRGRMAMKIASPPAKFAKVLAKALGDKKPYVKRAAGMDATSLMVTNRLLPARGMHQVSRVAMGLPKQGEMRPGAFKLGLGTRAMIGAAKVIPQPVMQRIVVLVMKFQKPSTPAAMTRPRESEQDEVNDAGTASAAEVESAPSTNGHNEGSTING
ncbi:SDR family oxidoreductase [Aldersonia kunmingensis]|uniref:SDR family oxidoreductase n=1 Tax=Aldersonia kunmingensis TaxID=408066 RepID=UPI000836F42C|nr:SDR family oxidoreductase [Aldersonia kunmingensis]